MSINEPEGPAQPSYLTPEQEREREAILARFRKTVDDNPYVHPPDNEWRPEPEDAGQTLARRVLQLAERQTQRRGRKQRAAVADLPGDRTGQKPAPTPRSKRYTGARFGASLVAQAAAHHGAEGFRPSTAFLFGCLLFEYSPGQVWRADWKRLASENAVGWRARERAVSELKKQNWIQVVDNGAAIVIPMVEWHLAPEERARPLSADQLSFSFMNLSRTEISERLRKFMIPDTAKMAG